MHKLLHQLFSNWSRDSAYGHGKDQKFVMRQIGQVAGRLYSVYSMNPEWADMTAKNDLRSFLVAATKVFEAANADRELKHLHKTVSHLVPSGPRCTTLQTGADRDIAVVSESFVR